MAQLAFSREFPQRLHFMQRETYFQEKIIAGLMAGGVAVPERYLNSKYITPGLIDRYKARPKIHTFRKVGARKRKPGEDIHFTVNARTKKSFQFAPAVPLHHTDTVEILWRNKKPGTFHVGIIVEGYYLPDTVINGGRIVYVSDEVKDLVSNDGFDSAKMFFQWFNKSGIYESINWTDHRYGINVAHEANKSEEE